MLIAIPNILDPAGVAAIRGIIDDSPWVDGNATSGPQAALAKRNEQLPEDSAAAVQAPLATASLPRPSSTTGEPPSASNFSRNAARSSLEKSRTRRTAGPFGAAPKGLGECARRCGR